MAVALRAFRDGTGTDDDYVGALLVTDVISDIHFVKQFLVSYAKAMKRRGRK